MFKRNSSQHHKLKNFWHARSSIIQNPLISSQLFTQQVLNSFPQQTIDKIKIIVKTFTGRTFFLQVHPSDLIDHIKWEIEDKSDIPIGSQRLLFGGNILKNGQRLNEYNVKNGSVIYCMTSKVCMVDIVDSLKLSYDDGH